MQTPRSDRGVFDRLPALVMPERPAVRGYLYALMLTMAALPMRLAIAPVDWGIRYVTFFPAVALSAVIGGLGPGLFAALAGVSLVTYLFWPPYHMFIFAFHKEMVLSNAAFLLAALVISVSAEAMHRYYRRFGATLEDFKQTAWELAESERKFRTIADNLPVDICRHDLDARALYVNPALARTFGHTPEEILGRSMHELAPDGRYSALEAAIHEAAATGEARDLEQVIHAPDGGKRYYAIRVVPEFGPDGKPVSVLTVARDVTNQKAEEEQLHLAAKASQIYARSLSTASLFDPAMVGDVASVVDFITSILQSSTEYGIIGEALDGTILLWNEGARRLFGYEPEEVVGKRNSSILHVPEDVQAGTPEKILDAAMRGGKWEGTIERQRKSGERFTSRVVITPRRDAQGRPVGYLLISKDISEEIRMGEKLRRAESRFRVLLEMAPDAMVILNIAGEITLVNAQTEHLFGFPRATLLGKSIEMLLPERFRASRPGAGGGFLDAVPARPGGPGRELCGLRVDGTEFPIEVTSSPIESEDGLVVASAIRDVTERRRIEQALLEKNMELESANLAKDRFLASMSHELRTPLNAIIGFSELLNDAVVGELAPEQKGLVADILASSEHLLSLINDILDLSKIEAGEMTLNLEPIDVDALLQGSIMVVRERAMEHGLHVSVEVQPGLGRLWGDGRKLKQILYNLLSNAVKFTPNGGEIRAVARRVDGKDVPMMPFPRYLELKITDTGVGIPPSAMPKLFQPFTQADDSLSRRYEGTGLGLAMVKKLAQLHGGEVAVESEVDRGSTFTVWIPWREEKR